MKRIAEKRLASFQVIEPESHLKSFHVTFRNIYVEYTCSREDCINAFISKKFIEVKHVWLISIVSTSGCCDYSF